MGLNLLSDLLEEVKEYFKELENFHLLCPYIRKSDVEWIFQIVEQDLSLQKSDLFIHYQ